MTRQAIRTAFVVATAVLVAGPAVPQTNNEKLEITAWAVNMSNVGTGSSATVDFRIDRWTTPEERDKLIAVMLEQGQDELLRTLQKMPSHGRMRFPTLTGPDPTNARLGWDIRYAWQAPLPEGGQRIVLALDRYIGFWEAANRPRTIDYPFTVIEMRLGKSGEGEGKMSIATKISFDRAKKVIELENYTSEPVRLQKIRVRSKT